MEISGIYGSTISKQPNQIQVSENGIWLIQSQHRYRKSSQIYGNTISKQSNQIKLVKNGIWLIKTQHKYGKSSEI